MYLLSTSLFSTTQRPVQTLCCPSSLRRVEMGAACAQLLFAAILWTMPYLGTPASMLSGPTTLLNGTSAGWEAADSDIRNLTSINMPRSRRKRAISSKEMKALLDYHNRVRSQVLPSAANMEFMVRPHDRHSLTPGKHIGHHFTVLCVFTPDGFPSFC